MVTERALAGRKILVTRPAGQCESLAEMIRDAGGEPIIFPLLDIVSRPLPESWPVELPQQHWLIFISRNAVNYFVSQSPPLPEGIRIAAVGRGTAQALADHHLPVDCLPAAGAPAGSEGLLQQPEMQLVQGQRVAIIRGQGGREWLGQSLRASGAEIRYIEVYQRQQPEPDAAHRRAATLAERLICTSLAALENLQALLSDWPQLKSCPLCVISERLQTAARQAGFQVVSVADGASDAALLSQLIEMEA